MGTFVERIRAGGAGLGGVLTPTGVGTVYEEGRQTLELGGRRYIVEPALTRDVAFIKGHIADEAGNSPTSHKQELQPDDGDRRRKS